MRRSTGVVRTSARALALSDMESCRGPPPPESSVTGISSIAQIGQSASGSWSLICRCIEQVYHWSLLVTPAAGSAAGASSPPPVRRPKAKAAATTTMVFQPPGTLPRSVEMRE